MPHPHWINEPSDFITTCIAMSVGLGNIWRFPFMAYENGGGAFLVAYIIVVAILGIPLYFFEIAIGQFSGKGSLKLFSTLAPVFTGIGVLQILCTALASSYYSALLAITLYYLIKSLNLPLPWSQCYTEYGNICVNSTNYTQKANMTSSVELFLTKYLLNEPENLDSGLGRIDWRLALAMFLTWFGVSFVLHKGSSPSENFNYFLAFYPYFVLFIMLGVALAQQGSAKGLEYFFSPKWRKLLDAKIWFHAVTQCFYSLGLGFGSLTLLSSYNHFNTEISSASWVIPFIDTCISILGGITSFAILGNIAERLGVEMDEVIRSGGIGILFITYPEALSKIVAAPFVLAMVCFIMIYSLGFATLVATQQVSNDQIMHCLNLDYWQASSISSIIGFLLGLPYITRGGMYMIQLVDHFGVAMFLYVLVLLEVLSIIYGYGLRSFCWDIEYMTTRPVDIWQRIVWSLITPIFLIVVFCCYLVTLSKGMHIKGIQYPTIALTCGWSLFFLGIILVPTTTLYEIFIRRQNGWPNMFWDIFNHDQWEPSSENDITEWTASRPSNERADNQFLDFFKALIRR